MAARRSPWLDQRAQLLVRLLADRGLSVSEDAAREDVSNHLDLVAARMRIGRQAAKVYVTDAVVQRLADQIAEAVQRHGQGAEDRADPRHLKVVPPPTDEA